jgi:hypothetical protein
MFTVGGAQQGGTMFTMGGGVQPTPGAASSPGTGVGGAYGSAIWQAPSVFGSQQISVRYVPVSTGIADRQQAEYIAVSLSQKHGLAFGVVKGASGYDVVGIEFGDGSEMTADLAKFLVTDKSATQGAVGQMLSVVDQTGVDRVDQKAVPTTAAAPPEAKKKQDKSEAPTEDRADPPASESSGGLQGPNDDRDNISRGFKAGEVSKDEAAEFLRKTGLNDDEVAHALG